MAHSFQMTAIVCLFLFFFLFFCLLIILFFDASHFNNVDHRYVSTQLGIFAHKILNRFHTYSLNLLVNIFELSFCTSWSSTFSLYSPMSLRFHVLKQLSCVIKTHLPKCQKSYFALFSFTYMTTKTLTTLYTLRI